MTRTRRQRPITDERRDAAESEIVEQSNRIDFYITEYSVEMLAAKTRSEEFWVPPYQREFIWSPRHKSRFIESLVMGLPIPFLFFWEMADGRLEIVDGSQRLRTIEEFILGDFRLGDLASIPTLSGFRFSDLPKSRQRKINNRPIRGIVLNEHTDAQARFDLFERINTGSQIAKKAEIRRGALNGPFMSLVIELSNSAAFIDLAPVSEKSRKEREREELVVRFFAYGDGLKSYRDRPSEFLFLYTKKMNSDFEEDETLIVAYRQRFHDMVEFVRVVFPYGFRRKANGKATPRARFEAISIGSFLALQQKPELAAQQPDVARWIDLQEFSKTVGADGANAIARLRGRTVFVRDRLLED